MKKTIILILLFLVNMCLYAQKIDPVLMQEMGQRMDDEKIKIVVIMKSQYDRQQLGLRIAHYTTRADRREFVVNELKQFAETSQHELRSILSEMERHDMTTAPKIIWMANALYFSATKQAINDLAERDDIEIIGLDEEKYALFDEEFIPTTMTRGIASHVTQVGANQVWNLGYTGQGVVVAVIDSGVNYYHRDLADHLWDGGNQYPNHGYDFVNNDNNPLDDAGHGTHCAGIVCGDGTAGTQTGLAPDATLMCVKVLNQNGYGSIAVTCYAMQWAVEQGCDVMSMSVGWIDANITERTLFRNTCAAVLDAGVIASIAAGNDGNKLGQYPIPNNVRLPGGCPPPYLDSVQEYNPGGLSCAICVGAVDYYDNAAFFTSRGPVTWSNTEFGDYPYTAGSNTMFGLIRPDVCAPGIDIVSADYSNYSGYFAASGTSMATPCVAGCISLLLSKNIDATPSEICQILEETSVHLTTGKSNVSGYGRVNVLAAINALNSNEFMMKFDEVIVLNDNNNNGILEAGETADLHVVISNTSNDTITSVVGTLSAVFPFLTINDTTGVFGDIEANGQASADFNVTLADSVPEIYTIDFSLDLVDGNEQYSSLTFKLTKGIIVFTDANVKAICVTHWDTDGDGELNYAEAANVTSLDNYFNNKTGIVSFDELQYFIGLSSIEANAFYNCSRLTSITIPNSVTMIGSYAFYNCSGLNSVYYTGNINQWCNISFSGSSSNPLYYAHNLFVDNDLVTDLVIPETIAEIKPHTFYGATCLTSLTISNSVTTIGSSAFCNCNNLTSLTISNSVTTIGSSAFYNCNSLTSIVIGNSVTSIGSLAFAGCSHLNSVYYTGNIYQWCNIAFLDYYSNPLFFAHNLFIENELVTNLIIPETVTEIKPYAFCGATCLTSLAISNSVNSIGNYAFHNCSGLTGSLTIPNSVISIGVSAFYCRNLNAVYYTGSIYQWCNIAFTDYYSNPLYYAHNLYIDNKLVTNLVIPKKITEIKTCAFNGATCLTSLTIPNSVNSIGNYAFRDCSSLISLISLAETPPILGTNVFYNVNKSIPVYVPNGTISTYQAALGWKDFTNYVELGPTVTQTTALSEGWNWFSTYIEVDDPVELLDALKANLGDNGLRIESDALDTEYLGNGEWIGDLDDEGMTNEQMYLIETSTECTVELQGIPAHPANHSITIYPGWNWIGFPCSEDVSLADALATFEAEEGDLIESDDNSAVFIDGEWIGLETLVSGNGYLYYSNSTVTKPLTFQTNQRNGAN